MPTTIYSFSSASGSSWSNASYATRDDSNRASYAANANSNISELIASGNFYTESGTNIVDGTNIKITKVEIGLKGYVSGANCYVNSELRLPDGSTWALGEKLSATSETTVWKDLTSSYSWTSSNIDDVQARCSGKNSDTKNSRTVYVNCFLVRITWEYEVKYTPSGSTSFTSTAEKTIEISRIASGSTVLSSQNTINIINLNSYISTGLLNLIGLNLLSIDYSTYISNGLISFNYISNNQIDYIQYIPSGSIVLGGFAVSKKDFNNYESNGVISFIGSITSSVDCNNYQSGGFVNIGGTPTYYVEFTFIPTSVSLFISGSGITFINTEQSYNASGKFDVLGEADTSIEFSYTPLNGINLISTESYIFDVAFFVYSSQGLLTISSEAETNVEYSFNPSYTINLNGTSLSYIELCYYIFITSGLFNLTSEPDTTIEISFTPTFEVYFDGESEYLLSSKDYIYFSQGSFIISSEPETNIEFNFNSSGQFNINGQAYIDSSETSFVYNGSGNIYFSSSSYSFIEISFTPAFEIGLNGIANYFIDILNFEYISDQLILFSFETLIDIELGYISSGEINFVSNANTTIEISFIPTFEIYFNGESNYILDSTNYVYESSYSILFTGENIATVDYIFNGSYAIEIMGEAITSYNTSSIYSYESQGLFIISGLSIVNHILDYIYNIDGKIELNGSSIDIVDINLITNGNIEFINITNYTYETYYNYDSVYMIDFFGSGNYFLTFEFYFISDGIINFNSDNKSNIEINYNSYGEINFTLDNINNIVECNNIDSYGSIIFSSITSYGYETSNTLYKNYESFGVFNLYDNYVNYYFYNAFYSYKSIQKNIIFSGGEEYKLGYNFVYDSYFNIIIFGGIKESTCDYVHETSGNINFKTNINNKIEYINYDSVGLININSASKYRVEFNYKILGKIEFNSATLVNLNCNTICYGGLNINETITQFINEVYFDSCINVSFNNNTLYKVNYNNYTSECLINFNYDGIYNYNRNYKYKSNGILNLNSGVSYSCGYNYLYNSYSYVILGGKGITNDFCINHLETPIQINITYTRRNYYLCREYISSGLILFDGISNYISSFNYNLLNNIIYLNNITYTYHSSDYVYNSNNRKLYLNGSSVVNEVEYILNCNHGFVINGYNKSKIDFSYFNTDSQLTIDSDDIHGLIIYNYKSLGGFSFNDHVHENVNYQYNSNGKINFRASNVGVIDFVYNYVDQHKIELFPSYCLNIEEKYYSEGNINICRTIPTSIFINFSYVSIGNLSIENPTLQALYEICFIVKETRRRIIFSGRPIYYPIRALYEQEINLQSEIGTVLYSKSKINDNTNVYSEIEKLVILRGKIK